MWLSNGLLVCYLATLTFQLTSELFSCLVTSVGSWLDWQYHSGYHSHVRSGCIPSPPSARPSCQQRKEGGEYVTRCVLSTIIPVIFEQLVFPTCS